MGASAQCGSRAHGNRRLADDDRWPGQSRNQFVDNSVDVSQIGTVLALLLRSADAEEVHVREIGCYVIISGELQTTRRKIVLQHLRQSGLVERNVARRQFGNLAWIDIDPDDVMAELGHSGGVGRS